MRPDRIVAVGGTRMVSGAASQWQSSPAKRDRLEDHNAGWKAGLQRKC